jgi:FAD/FMN-containing dehydrogenase
LSFVFVGYTPYMTLLESLKARLVGDVLTDNATRKSYSRDTSVFERTPEIVVYPKDTHDVAELVKTVAEAKREGESASVTARAAGTDMSGGPLTDSVVAVFTKYMNKTLEVGDGYALAEPGVYYRDFEKETRKIKNQLLPSFPASRDLCALGGIVNNNSGGERTLEYGKTEKYVEELEVVLADGTVTTFKALSQEELAAKKALDTLEGKIYREVDELITDNSIKIKAAKPKVAKNSAGYALWNVKDEAKGTFDLAQLVTGAQGTLALTTKMKLGLVPEQGYRSMLVIFLSDFALLPEIVHKILPFTPESFESYDDHTFKLAIRLLPQLLANMGFWGAVRLGLSFLPDVLVALRGGIPRLVLMAEFSEDTAEESLRKARLASTAIGHLDLSARVLKNARSAEKYWKVRHEAFAILRKKLPGLTAAPFIDDFVVPPDSYPEFLPQLFALLDAEKFMYAVTGHIGDGNFHIFPLIDLKDPNSHKLILDLSPKIYELVIRYGGTTTGEHNDGIVRTPYLSMLFGPEVVKLFEKTKRIFDPENIFNPGKKDGGSFKDIELYMQGAVLE